VLQQGPSPQMENLPYQLEWMELCAFGLLERVYADMCLSSATGMGVPPKMKTEAVVVCTSNPYTDLALLTMKKHGSMQIACLHVLI